MPARIVRREVARRDAPPLSLGQLVELHIGPGQGSAAFASEAARKAAWQAHRARLMAKVPGKPPWAFWQYEGPAELRDGDAAMLPGDDGWGPCMARREALEHARSEWLREHPPTS